jgi:hypothetical protein
MKQWRLACAILGLTVWAACASEVVLVGILHIHTCHDVDTHGRIKEKTTCKDVLGCIADPPGEVL